LKKAIIERQRAAGLDLAPAGVEQEFRRLCQTREVRQSLKRLIDAGARVHYLTGDVRDSAELGGLIDAVYQRHGRIDGVIHGAGIIEDKLVKDKKLDSFDRVVETKVNGALTLARRLRPGGLKFVVFFSSIAGRIGNRGQADYSAANEVLNKLAVWLGSRVPAHVVAVNWGPWATLGMATPEVQRQFAERGISLVPVEAGCQYLIEELMAGRKRDHEVVVAGGPAFGAARSANTAYSRV
jgi:NAD(P)-dependent dehydrogenase (short-subunit alcohol dehydrogenase family)